MGESRTLDDDALRGFLTRELERIPQDCRNRYSKRIETMGAEMIAILIVKRMRAAGWEVQVPVRDPTSAQMAYNRTHLKE